MSQQSQIQFPGPIKTVIDLIEKNPKGEEEAVLLHYLASFVHPDTLCNLAMMNKIATSKKEAAVKMFEYCLYTGLSVDEQGDILKYLQPHIFSGISGNFLQ